LDDRARRPRSRSLEKHMLENMRQPGAEMLVLVDASGATPCLHTDDRRAAILLHNNGKPVRQNAFLRGAGRKRKAGAAFGWGGFKMGGQHMDGQATAPRAAPLDLGKFRRR
jgi:hypothetical protein